jgi:hypothetical protein
MERGNRKKVKKGEGMTVLARAKGGRTGVPLLRREKR